MLRPESGRAPLSAGGSVVCMSIPSRPGVLAVLLVAVLTVAACGGDDGSVGRAADPKAGLPEVAESEFEDLTGQASVTVDAKDNLFDEQYVTVSPGTEITFENQGRNPHNVVAAQRDQFETIPVDQLPPGGAATLVLDEPGIYPYYCSLHGSASAGMVGRIRVAQD